MKRATYTFSVDFDDDVSDDDCYKSLIEIVQQDGEFYDNQLKIEYIKDE